jgi:ferredoxin, 2Fe-2S
MSVVTFVSHDGEKHEAPLDADASLMQIAVDNIVPGVDGDCGGEAACGTCHVIVEDEWVAKVGRSGPVEEEMLAMNPEREPTSRLACQMRVTDDLNGLVVRLPEFQL